MGHFATRVCADLSNRPTFGEGYVLLGVLCGPPSDKGLPQLGERIGSQLLLGITVGQAIKRCEHYRRIAQIGQASSSLAVTAHFPRKHRITASRSCEPQQRAQLFECHAHIMNRFVAVLPPWIRSLNGLIEQLARD
jgi:hypothetical protein